jgi:hypothetical protein
MTRAIVVRVAKAMSSCVLRVREIFHRSARDEFLLAARRFANYPNDNVVHAFHAARRRCCARLKTVSNINALA